MVGATGRGYGWKNCTPKFIAGVLAATADWRKTLEDPEDLAKHTLLHDASRRDWQTYPDSWG